LHFREDPLSHQRRKNRRLSFWGILPTLSTLAAVQGTASGGGGAHQPAPVAHRPATIAGLSQHLTPAAPLLAPTLKISPSRDFGYLHRMPEFHAHAKIASAPPAAAKPRILAAATPAATAAPTPASDITLDSTLVTAQPVPFSNNTYTITPDLGRQIGGNLFFSFSSFNLPQGQIASFTTGLLPPAASVKNVLARVTGGSASSIDGVLQCTISSANFYLINPAGILFGPDSSLNANGSFAATTSSYIGLADGRQFNAAPMADNLLTTAAPAAFGFVDTNAGGVTVQGSLAVGVGKSISLVGGTVIVDGTVNPNLPGPSLAAPGGRVNLLGAVSAGEFRFDPSSLASNVVISGVAQRGIVEVLNTATGSAISVDGPQGGRVLIDASTVRINQATIAAMTAANGKGRGIEIDATGPVIITDSILDTTASGSGTAGTIQIDASAIALGGRGYGISITADGNGTANPGNIILSSRLCEIGGTFPIVSAFSDSGAAGTITISGAVTNDGVPASINTDFGFLSLLPLGSGNVTLDSTFGTAVPLTGPYFFVPPGKQVGTNLFQSLGTLDLLPGEFLVFTGPANVSNVLVRVTGGAARIDGYVTCNIPGANLFLIDSAGVACGPDSFFYPGGSFGLTTANSFVLGRSGGFNAAGAIPASLSSAAVSGFSFTGGSPAPILFQGEISLSTGKVVSLVGGDIITSVGATQLPTNTSAYIVAPGSRMNLVAVRSPGTVELDPADLNSTISVPTGSGADIAMIDSLVDVSGPTGGRLVGRAANFLLEDTYLTATTLGAGNGMGVDISLRGSAIITAGNGLLADSIGLGVFAVTDPDASGTAGNITFSAASLQMDGGGEISATSLGLANAGDITLNITGPAVFTGDPTTSIVTGLFTDSRARGPGGSAGNITLNAGTLQMTGLAWINSQTDSTAPGGHIVATVQGSAILSDGAHFLATSTAAATGGSAGSIMFSANSLQLLSGASITSSTFGDAQGGGVTVNIMNQAVVSGNFSEISATTYGTGNAGEVTVTAGSLQVTDGGLIGTNTYGSGNGGNVTVTVTGSAVVDGTGSTSFTGISSQSLFGAAGNAGKVIVNAGQLQILNGGQISSSTSGPGAGGDVAVNAPGGTIMLDGSNPLGPSGVTAASISTTTGGNAGNITLAADSISITNGAAVSSAASGSETGGNISITSNALSLQNGQISASAFMAGRVTINSPMVTLAGGSVISTDTIQSSPNGSDVAIYAASLSLDGSTISAQTAGDGIGGNVQISAAMANGALGVTLTNNSLISAATSGSGTGGDITIAAGTFNATGSRLSASSTGAGTAGSVNVTTSDLLSLTSSNVTTQAGGNAGGITLMSATSVLLTDSLIQAQTQGNSTSAKGGDIVIGGSTIHLSGGSISATAAELGSGGSVMLTADSFLAERNAMVLASTSGSGAAGNVSLNVLNDATLTTNATLSAGTSSSGIGNEMNITARSLTLAGGFITADTSASGTGGNVVVTVSGPVLIRDEGGISASAFSSATGAAGGVTVKAMSLNLVSGSISSSNAGSSVAGDVQIDVKNVISIDGGSVSATAANAQGGNISIQGGSFSLTGRASQVTTLSAEGGSITVKSRHGRLLLRNQALITAQTNNGDGGNIELDATGLLFISDSKVKANAKGKGGKITIDPPLVLLENSIIDGRANGQDVKVSIARDAVFVQSSDSQILSNNVSLPPQSDVSGALLALPSSLPQVTLALVPVCGPRLEADFSSFVVTGTGGRPPGPEGWMPDLLLSDQADTAASLISERRVRSDGRR
jgi:filamentous hemagglutinin family protein